MEETDRYIEQAEEKNEKEVYIEQMNTEKSYAAPPQKCSVTGRIKQISQPRGGYINPSRFTVEDFDDNAVLNAAENVHPSIIGLAVDYLTRYMMGADSVDAFKISLIGAENAQSFGMRNAPDEAKAYLNNITGLDSLSIESACKLAAFDVWYRNPAHAPGSKQAAQTLPDSDTVYNIYVMVKRCMAFWDTCGPIVKDGFDFKPFGYTDTVVSGDGDYLTEDTLWDLKVSKKAPAKEHTLQLLMYWIMGCHSGQSVFKNITKLGIFNPRLNKAYTLDIAGISPDIIKEVERDVICY